MFYEKEENRPRLMEKYTDRGLEKTYVSMFQKAGWMMIALSRRSDLKKVEYYLERLEVLSEELKERLDIVKDEDKRRNYKIMIQNLLDLDRSFVKLLDNYDNDTTVLVKGSQFMHATSHYEKKDSDKMRLADLSKKNSTKNPYFNKW